MQSPFRLPFGHFRTGIETRERRVSNQWITSVELLEGRMLLSAIPDHGPMKGTQIALHGTMSMDGMGMPTQAPMKGSHYVLHGTMSMGGMSMPTQAPRLRVGQPFAQPPEFASKDGVLRVTLVAQEQMVKVGGKSIKARVYDGSYVGPTLRVHPGDHVEIALVNHLNEPTNLHFHGMHISPAGSADNAFLEVAPGQTFLYQFDIPANHPTGLYWYHSHADMMSEEQVFGGLSGLISVEGLKDKLPPPLRGIQEKLFALKDMQVTGDSIFKGHVDSSAPTTRTVNGLAEPKLTIRPGETQLWRFGNVGANIFYTLHLDGHHFVVIAEDGNPVSTPFTADDLVMPPGKRFEVLVQGGKPGMSVLRTFTSPGSQSSQTLATLLTRGHSEHPAALPTFIAPFDDLHHDPIAQHRKIVFSQDESGMQFFINGQQFDKNRVDVHAKLGTTEEWEIVNRTHEQHPFHLHTNPFQVVSVNGVPYNAHGYQDTVVLPSVGSVVIRMRFKDFVGKTMFHCHILHHEDMGMMSVIDIEA